MPLKRQFSYSPFPLSQQNLLVILSEALVQRRWIAKQLPAQSIAPGVPAVAGAAPERTKRETEDPVSWATKTGLHRSTVENPISRTLGGGNHNSILLPISGTLDGQVGSGLRLRSGDSGT